MKRFILVILALFLAVFMISCGHKPDSGVYVEEVVSYPDAYVGEGISARGLDESIAREQAKANALIDISQQIEVEVKSLSETYMRGTTSTSSDAATALSDQDFMRVAKVVTSNFLRGATPKRYEHRRDGTIKAIVIMPKAELYEEMRTRIPDQVKREALRVQIQHDDAQKRLNAEIDKREKELE